MSLRASGDQPVDPGLEDRVAFLKRPETYPDRPEHVETVETHMAWVFLTQRFAWKLKKPVRTEHLDFSTVEARHSDCRREVELNERLAPAVYYGVVPLTLDRSRRMQLAPARLAAGAVVIDWLVQMRRLSRTRMLDVLIAQGNLAPSDIEPAAVLLSRFYACAPPCELDGAEYRRRLRAEIDANRRILVDAEFDSTRVAADRLLDDQAVFVDRHGALLEDRVACGRVIEAHGDLRPEHICLEPQPVVIDCLEFNRDLRLLDSASELTFLSLECARLGAPWVGRQMFETYMRIVGDRPDARLLSFYRTWHATTRARIALLHLRDHDPRAPDKWLDRARRYLELAARG